MNKTLYFTPGGDIYTIAKCDDCDQPYFKWENHYYVSFDKKQRDLFVERQIAKGLLLRDDSLETCECEREDKEEN